MAFKVFVSLPMRGRTEEDIRRRQQELFDKFARPNWELIDTVTPDENADPNNRLWYLGRSIQLLGEANVVIFAKDWRLANGCIIEHLITEAYDILSLYEE